MNALAMKFDPRHSRADRAMKFLRQGIEGGYRDEPHIRNDSDLVSLHDRADYRLLMLDLGFPTDPFQR
jgi:eukaryotic-like serine/threonine-protein kinase